MFKRLLSVSIILLIIFSLTSCMASRKAHDRQVGIKPTQALNQDKSLSPGTGDDEKDISKGSTGTKNPSESHENTNAGSPALNSSELIDDTLKTLRDMGGISDSLENPSDDDLAVPIPQ